MKYKIIEKDKNLGEYDNFETACRSARNFGNSSKNTIKVVDIKTGHEYYSSRWVTFAEKEKK